MGSWDVKLTPEAMDRFRKAEVAGRVSLVHVRCECTDCHVHGAGYQCRDVSGPRWYHRFWGDEKYQRSQKVCTTCLHFRLQLDEESMKEVTTKN